MFSTVRSIMHEQKDAFNAFTTKTKIVTGTIGAVAVLSIFGVGTSTPEAAPAPKPVVRTETVEVETVPQECLVAINKAEAIGLLTADFATATSDAMENAQDGIMAAASRDAAALEAVGASQQKINERVDALAEQVGTQVEVFNAAKAVCREAAEEGA